MYLTDLLSDTTLILDLAVEDKWDLIARLGAHLHASRSDWPVGLEDFQEAIAARERQITTGLERGIAFPHGLLPAGSPSAGALAVVRRGIDFASLDGEPVRFVLMMVLPDDSEGRARHLDLLATGSRLFVDVELREALLAAGKPAEALAALVDAERRILG